MPFPTKLGDFITAAGTDYKTFRTFMTGSATGAFSLATTAQDLKGAVAELKAAITAAAGGMPTNATESAVGVGEIATQAETTTGTDDFRWVTPLKLAQKLTAWAQPLSANLTTLAGVASGAFGRTLLTAADATAAKSSLGLANVATTGAMADLTGQVSTAQLPPLAINETFTAANQAAMLALTAQRGDVAIRSDAINGVTGKMFLLASDSPSTLADWKPIVATGDVQSVAGRVGAVTLTKTDVGLANVDNTSDVNKPVSTAQAAADALNLKIASNLSDLNSVATARNNLSVYSKAEIGDPETDLVALYTAAKA